MNFETKILLSKSILFFWNCTALPCPILWEKGLCMSLSHVGLSYNYRSQDRNGGTAGCARLKTMKGLTRSQNLEGVSLHVFCGFVVWLQDGQTNRPDVIRRVVPSVPGKAIDTILSKVHTMPQNEGIFRPAISICLTVQLHSKSLLSVFSY